MKLHHLLLPALFLPLTLSTPSPQPQDPEDPEYECCDYYVPLANPLERAYCRKLSNLKKCIECLWESRSAKSEAEESFPMHTLHNGDGDAFRHCYWNVLMTVKFGVAQAKTFADLHEDGDDKQPANEKFMDLANNEFGRSCGVKALAGAATDKTWEGRMCCYNATIEEKLVTLL